MSIPSPGRQGLGDARVSAGEVLVILQRYDAVQSHDREWRVATNVFERFGVVSAGARERINHAFNSERPRQQQTDLLGFDQPAAPYAFAISRARILPPGRQSSARHSIAELHSGFTVIAEPSDEDAFVWAVAVKRRRFAPE